MKLVIEIDGGYHQYQIEKDNWRTQELSNLGIEVTRFINEEVENKITSFLQIIAEKIKLKFDMETVVLQLSKVRLHTLFQVMAGLKPI